VVARLFGVDVLAGLEGCANERRVRCRRRQIENELDVGIRDQLLDRLRPESVRVRKRRGGAETEVGAGDRSQVGKATESST
jgi:hypothetical protein